MQKVKKIAIQHPYEAVAETQSAARFISTAKKFGIEVRELRNSCDIVDFSPDFVLSLSHQDPKLTPFPTYGVMTAPQSFYETPRFIRNILTYDGYLTVTDQMSEWLTDICFGARKISTPIGFYANTVSSLTTPPIPSMKDASLMYIGTNWDGNRHGKLFDYLSKLTPLKVYGPRKNWTGHENVYCGEIPFDEQSVLERYNQCGLGLCLDRDDFARESMPSSRVYECLAANALPICYRTDFYEKWFGDNLLYIDTNVNSIEIANQVAERISWVKKHPELAKEKLRNSVAIYADNFSLDVMIDNLLAYHARLLINKGYTIKPLSTDTESTPLVGTIIRTGGRDERFLIRALDSIRNQTYRNLTVLCVIWQNKDSIEKILACYPEVNFHVISLPGGDRSDSLWAGLRGAMEIGCNFIGVLDDDDEYHCNAISSLINLAQYHDSLSFREPVSLYFGGTLVCYENAILNKTLDINDSSKLWRAETTYVRNFHFASRGNVDDETFKCSPSGMLINASFIDQEILQNPKLKIGEDYYIWMQLAERGKCVFLPEIVATVHEHGVDQSEYHKENEANYYQRKRVAYRSFGRRYYSTHELIPSYASGHYKCTSLSATYPISDREYHRESAVSVTEIPPAGETNSTLVTKWIFSCSGYFTFNFIAPFESTLNSDIAVVINSPIRKQNYRIDTSSATYRSNSTGASRHGIKFLISEAEIDSEISVIIQGLNTRLADISYEVFRLSKHEENPVSLSTFKRVWLYGAGNYGIFAHGVLSERNIEIQGIVDTFAKGEWMSGLHITPLEQFLSEYDSGDVVIISSMYWRDIAIDLRRKGVWIELLSLQEPKQFRGTLEFSRIY